MASLPRADHQAGTVPQAKFLRLKSKSLKQSPHTSVATRRDSRYQWLDSRMAIVEDEIHSTVEASPDCGLLVSGEEQKKKDLRIRNAINIT